MTTHTERDFEQLLNEIYKPASIAGSEYEAGYALRLVDPIMFRESYLNWLDSENIPDGYEGIDFDTLPEDIRDMPRRPYKEMKDIVLTEGGWDWTAVISDDGMFCTVIIDSENLDEYEFDEQSGLYVSPYGPEMCAGCIDYITYQYDPLTHEWDEVFSALFEYYPCETLKDFYDRNGVL